MTDKPSPTASSPRFPLAEFRGLLRKDRLPASALTLSDLRRLYAELAAKASEAFEDELSKLDTSQMTAEDRELQVAQLRDAARLTTIVLGSQGEQIAARNDTPLNDSRLPPIVNAISFDSAFGLQGKLPNRFLVILDLADPPPPTEYNPWNTPTPNDSRVEVIGTDETWVSAVYDLVIRFFENRATARSWLHKTLTYNALTWLIAWPAALWIAYRIDVVAPASFQS